MVHMIVIVYVPISPQNSSIMNISIYEYKMYILISVFSLPNTGHGLFI